MKRVAILAIIAAPALAASASVPPVRETVGQALARVSAEAEAAARRVAAMESRERAATDEASRLRAAQQRAAADIELTEARIARADIELAAARAAVAERSARFGQRRAPLAALLAGLATMGRRPPLLALADSGSISDLVRVRALIDTSMPVIAARSAALKVELDEGRALAARAKQARLGVAAARAELVTRQQRFAELEQRANARAALARADASGADDEVLADSEQLLDLGGEAAAAAEARRAARRIASAPLAPARPLPADGPAPRPSLPYALPTPSPVIEGMGAVNASGVRSRGLRFATARGSAVLAPAAGTVLFAGPFRDHDGIVVIEHDGGWTSLLIDVSPRVERGARVAAGDPIGRALGDLQLELRHDGQPVSAALIAGSSRLLFNRSRLR